MSEIEKLTDAQLAEVLGLDEGEELSAVAKVTGESHLDTMYIQTCAGAWICLNSPGSLWEFREDEEWDA